jgi:hypothetical protein
VGKTWSKAERAEAAADFARLRGHFDELAAMRRQLGKAEMPEDLRQTILGFRQTLREAGLTHEMIDATPGLELP